MNTSNHSRINFSIAASLVLLVSFLLISCSGGGGGGDNANPKLTYTVTYDGNGCDSGIAPIDSGNYEAGQTVTVPGNTGSLVKAGNSFVGWNTLADGTGTTYAQSQTFTIGSANVTLYAKWTVNPTFTVTYGGNGSIAGSVPVDTTNYEAGQTVTVLGNTGNLVKAGYSFVGWNTLADGSGTTYTQAQTFAMGSANVILYAKWTANPTYTVTYDGNGSTGGSVPSDTINYEQGQTVTVLGNTGSLVKAGYFFTGWNSQADGLGTTYGATFTMGTANITLYAKWNVNPVLATIATATISSITVTTATGGGSITNDGGAAITARGICWSTGINPTISDLHTSDGTGIGGFTSSLTGLAIYTKYFVRAYATNSVGTAYGNSVSFTTGYGHILDANTVALWRLNEVSATSNAADETGSFELTQFGNPDIISGQIGNGRLLDGSSKFFQRSGDANLGAVFNGDWTYEGWVYLDPAISFDGELFIYNGKFFASTDSDTILADVGVGSSRKIFWRQWQSRSSYTEITSSAALQTGQFYHIAVSRASQGGNLFTYRIYVNGVLDTVTTDVAGLSYAVPGDSHYIGLGSFTCASGLPGGNPLNGRLDDTRISKVVRSDAEIHESYERRGNNPPSPAYTVTYDGNGSSGGNVPLDSTAYVQGNTVTVIGNTGGLVTNLTQDGITNLSFHSWNTQADGNGTSYTPGQTFTMGAANSTLYAKWSVLRGTGPAGGLIFYDKGSYSGSPSWRYLEAAPAAAPIMAAFWGANGSSIGGTGTAIGDGRANTAAIVSWLTGTGETGRAAQQIVALTYNGYSDWFLPSKDELWEMFSILNQHGVGGFIAANYWSSSENSATTAWHQDFYYGFRNATSKDNYMYVRAVRAF